MPTSWLNLRRCRIRHKRTRHEHITPLSCCPTLNPASGHDIYWFNVTCMSEERPGSGCCSTHRPCSRACSLGSAWFCSACPSRQLAALIKAELSPSFCTVTSERISGAQSAFTNTADAGDADGNSSLRPWAKPHPTYSITSSLPCTVLLWRRLPTATPLALMFPRSVGDVAVNLSCPIKTTPELDQRCPASRYFVPSHCFHMSVS